MGTMQNYPIAIVDSNELTRAGLAIVLRSLGLEAAHVQLFADGTVFETSLNTQRIVTVIVVDHELNLKRLMHATRRWRTVQPTLRIIVISDNLTQRAIRFLSSAGVRGYLLMTDDAAVHLFEALDRVAYGHYISPQLGESIIRRTREAEELQLRYSHLDVLKLISSGHTNHEIAQILGYTHRTLYRIRSDLREALNTRSNEQMVDEARRSGLIDRL